MASYLHLSIGFMVAAQWLHLAIRQRSNRRVTSLHLPEIQVIGLSVSFLTGFISWLAGLGAVNTTSNALLAVAVLAAFAGASLRIVAIETVGRGFSWGSAVPDTLVTSGIYRRIKHPLILGFVLEAVALLLSGEAPAILKSAASVTLLISARVQIKKEEAVLAARFGPIWTKYASGKII
jgi:protein-S-isoprenylcysteine O-methyltransferase Ste14